MAAAAIARPPIAAGICLPAALVGAGVVEAGAAAELEWLDDPPLVWAAPAVLLPVTEDEGALATVPEGAGLAGPVVADCIVVPALGTVDEDGAAGADEALE